VIANMVILALLLQISDRARRPAEPFRPGPVDPPSDLDVSYP
jgi:hypothetical protein